LISKLRKCKYGNRLSNGKCPKKPTSAKTRKLRKCKYGERLSNGKCPKKLKHISAKSETKSKTQSRTLTDGVGNMNTTFLVHVHSTKEFKMKESKLIDVLGEILIMDADADLQASTMNMTSHSLSFKVKHQTIEDSNGNYTKENIMKVIKAELKYALKLDDVESYIMHMGEL